MLSEKAKSRAQQRFFGMVRAAQKGEMENPSPEITKVASTVSKSDVKKMASTKHKGLPAKIEEKVGGTGTLIRQGVKVGGKKGGRVVQAGTKAATTVGKEAAASAAQGNQTKMVGSGKWEKRGAATGGAIGGAVGAAIPDGPAMVAGEIAGGIAGSKLGGKIGRQLDKRAEKKKVEEAAFLAGLAKAAVAGGKGMVKQKAKQAVKQKAVNVARGAIPQPNRDQQESVDVQKTEDQAAKKMNQIKKQVLLKKLQAVRSGGGETVTASYKPESQMTEGAGRAAIGAGLGAMVGGPVGAAIGGSIGAAMGKKKKKVTTGGKKVKKTATNFFKAEPKVTRSEGVINMVRKGLERDKKAMVEDAGSTIGGAVLNTVVKDTGVGKEIGGIAKDAIRDKRNLLRKMRGEKPLRDKAEEVKVEGELIDEANKEERTADRYRAGKLSPRPEGKRHQKKNPSWRNNTANVGKRNLRRFSKAHGGDGSRKLNKFGTDWQVDKVEGNSSESSDHAQKQRRAEHEARRGVKTKGVKKEELSIVDKMLIEYSPTIVYQDKKKGKLGKSSIYSLRDKDESKKDFRKSHVKDVEDGYVGKGHKPTPGSLKKEEIESLRKIVEEVGISSSAAMEKARKEAQLQAKEDAKVAEKKKKKPVVEGSAYGLWKGDGKVRLPGELKDKKKKQVLRTLPYVKDVKEAKVDAGKSPEEKEKDRNVRKFGVSHNVAGHGKLRRALHRSNRGDKKIPGDKSQYVETEAYRVLAKDKTDLGRPAAFSYKDEKDAKKFADSIKSKGGKATVHKEGVMDIVRKYRKKQKSEKKPSMDATTKKLHKWRKDKEHSEREKYVSPFRPIDYD